MKLTFLVGTLIFRSSASRLRTDQGTWRRVNLTVLNLKKWGDRKIEMQDVWIIQFAAEPFQVGMSND